jgi:hypothetical protein
MPPTNKVLVYVQAVPISVSDKARSFKDFASGDFRMSHSSQLALDRALKISNDAVALGHSSILCEALARGAKQASSVPLCDDPVIQAESFRDDIRKSESAPLVIVGENLDGPFTGAAFCGALSQIYDLSFSIDDLGIHAPLKKGCVVLVKDPGSEVFNIDIRTINYATARKFDDAKIFGESMIERMQRQTIEVSSEQSPKEIALMISRKLNRFSS